VRFALLPCNHELCHYADDVTPLKADRHFQNPGHYELFNMTADPHQLLNLYYTSVVSSEAHADLQARLLKQWVCEGVACP
jgi:hypothetical protein